MNKADSQLLDRKADVFNALAHPLRLAIVEFLRNGERCVCEIVDYAGAEQSNTSRHLALMVRGGVLTKRKKGLNVYYRVRCACVLDFLDCVDGVLRAQLQETEQMLKCGGRKRKG